MSDVVVEPERCYCTIGVAFVTATVVVSTNLRMLMNASTITECY